MRPLREIQKDIQTINKKYDELGKKLNALYKEQAAARKLSLEKRVQAKFKDNSYFIVLEEISYHNNVVALYEFNTFKDNEVLVHITYLRANDGDFFTVIKTVILDYDDLESLMNATELTKTQFTKIKDILLRPLVDGMEEQIAKIERIVAKEK